MVKALTNYKQLPDGSFQATGVAENRIAPFLMYALHVYAITLLLPCTRRVRLQFFKGLAKAVC